MSYRLKLELPRILLEEDRLGSLAELACLQAYLTFVASGQIQCKEDLAMPGYSHRHGLSYSVEVSPSVKVSL